MYGLFIECVHLLKYIRAMLSIQIKQHIIGTCARIIVSTDMENILADSLKKKWVEHHSTRLQLPIDTTIIIGYL